MEKLVLIDGHSIINRAFYGVPELTNSEGLHTNGVYGFLNILFKILDEEGAGHLAVAFEDDPEEEIRKLNSRRGELERALSAHESDNQQNRVQYEQAKEGVSALNRLLPRLNLLADDTPVSYTHLDVYKRQK